MRFRTAPMLRLLQQLSPMPCQMTTGSVRFRASAVRAQSPRYSTAAASGRFQNIVAKRVPLRGSDRERRLLPASLLTCAEDLKSPEIPSLYFIRLAPARHLASCSAQERAGWSASRAAFHVTKTNSVACVQLLRLQGLQVLMDAAQ